MQQHSDEEDVDMEEGHRFNKIYVWRNNMQCARSNFLIQIEDPNEADPINHFVL